MKLFTKEHRPELLETYRKTGTVSLAFISEPFQIDTQEGVMTISPETVDDWDNGYYIAYPSDESKPYSISPSFVRKNYERFTARDV